MAGTQELKYKKRLGNMVAGALLLGVTANWGLMTLLSLTGVGEVASEVLGATEDVALATTFVMLGVYGSKKSGQQIFVTAVCSAAELVPFVNDVPFGLFEVVGVVIISRIEDRERAEGAAAAAQQQALLDEEGQANRQILSLEAAKNARDRGPEAMRISKERVRGDSFEEARAA